MRKPSTAPTNEIAQEAEAVAPAFDRAAAQTAVRRRMDAERPHRADRCNVAHGRAPARLVEGPAVNEPLEGPINPFGDLARAAFGKPGTPLEPIMGEVCCVEKCPWCQVAIAIPRSRYNEHARYACEPCGRAELERIRQRAEEGGRLLERLAHGPRGRR